MNAGPTTFGTLADRNRAGRCVRCGAADGEPCDPDSHDAHADIDPARYPYAAAHLQRIQGHAIDCEVHGGQSCTCVGTAAERSISRDIATWESHRRICKTCDAALLSSELCLAGAELWKRAGLEVVPVPIPYARPTTPQPGHVLTMRTSDLLTVVASVIESTGLAADAMLAGEVRVRARAMRAAAESWAGTPRALLLSIGEVQP